MITVRMMDGNDDVLAQFELPVVPEVGHRMSIENEAGDTQMLVVVGPFTWSVDHGHEPMLEVVAARI